MQHGCGSAFIDFKGRVAAAGWLQLLMPSGCNRAKDLHSFSWRGGSNPWNELLSKLDWNESFLTLQAPGSEWHTAENIPPDTDLSGSSSSCQTWAAPSLTAITVSWPTFTSAAVAASLHFALLSLCTHIWFQLCSERLNRIKLQQKRLILVRNTLWLVVVLNTIYPQMRRQGRRPCSAPTPLPVDEKENVFALVMWMAVFGRPLGKSTKSFKCLPTVLHINNKVYLYSTYPNQHYKVL